MLKLFLEIIIETRFPRVTAKVTRLYISLMLDADSLISCRKKLVREIALSLAIHAQPKAMFIISKVCSYYWQIDIFCTKWGKFDTTIAF